MDSNSASIKRFSHYVGQNWYHVVLIPKYRNPVFGQAHQRQLMLEALDWLCPRHKIDLYAKEVMDDHVHLFVSCPPGLPISRLIGRLKGGTSYFMRSRHPPLRKYREFWSRGAMYRSIGTVSADTVKRYIQESNTAMRGQKRLL
jgi:putative transposase